MTAQITYVLPYYNQPKMLLHQLLAWTHYTEENWRALKIIVVDDGSPVSAESVMRENPIRLQTFKPDPITTYRIDVDIPWNRAGARNLGSHVAETEWLLHTDTDHVLSAPMAAALTERLPTLSKKKWYRFARVRVGAADETRKKDKIPDDCAFGEIKPHIDSYLCQRLLYWKVGGYDEDYSGCLGGGSPFLKQLEAAAAVEVLPEVLHVHTRHSVSDASAALDRDTNEYTRRRKAKERAGNTKAKNPLRFPWHRVF